MSSQMNSNRCYLVMWPDEQDVNTNTATSNVMAGHQQQLSSSSTSGAGSLDSMPQSPPKTLVHINGRGSTSSDEGAAVDAIGSTSSGHQHPVARIPVTRLAYPFVLPREYQDMQSKLEDDSQSIATVKNSQGARFVVAGNDAATTTLLDTNSGTTFVSVSTPSSGSTGSLPATVEQHCDHHANACSKCVLKETENRNLRKRVQALEEQLCRAIGNKRPKIVSAASSSGMEPTLITLTPPAAGTPTTLPLGGSIPSQQKLMRSSTSTSSRSSTRYNNHHGQQLVKTDSGSSMRLVPIPSNMQHSIDLNYSRQSSSTNNNNTVSNRTSTSTSSHTANNATPTSMRSSTTEKQQSFGDQADDRIELVPGTNVFISTSKLQQILSIVKTGKQLARKLMSIYWDRVTLARSTLSASSQHYDQLDPNTVTAIKTFCVLFDSSSRKSEIHSTMIDKCVQARRPRRSSLRQHGGNPTTTTSGASSPGINLGQVAAEGEESHQRMDMGGDLLNTEEGSVHSSASSVTVQRPLSKHREENHPNSGNNSSSQIFRFSSSEIPKQQQQLGRSNNSFMVPPLVGMASNIKDNDKRHAPEEGTYFMISEEQVQEKSQESTPITKGSIVGPFTVIDDNNKESYYRESDTYSGGGSQHGAGLTTTTTNLQQVQSLTPDYRGDDNPSPSLRAGDSGHDSPTLIIHLPAVVEGNESSPAPQLSYDIDNQHGGRQSEEGHIINTTTEQSDNGNAVPSSYHHEEVSEIVEFSDDDDNSGSSDSEMEESDSHYLIHIPPAAAVVSESGQQQQQHYQYVTDTTAPSLPHTMMPHQHHDNHQ